MKFLVTTAAAALLTAGVAYAEGDKADVNAAAQSTITTAGGLDAGAHAGVHAFSDLDADASGDLSLAEAQAFDPSVTATAFGGFDANADGVLDEDEYSSWAAEFDTNVGQGDASDADVWDAPEADLGLDVEGRADGAVDIQ